MTRSHQAAIIGGFLAAFLFAGVVAQRQAGFTSLDGQEPLPRSGAGSDSDATPTMASPADPADVWKSLVERRWANRHRWMRETPERTRERILKSLDDTTEIEFVGTRLNEALAFLSDLHNITIVLDSDNNADPQVTAVYSGITLRECLTQLLGPFKLGFSISDSVLKVHPLNSTDFRGM